MIEDPVVKQMYQARTFDEFWYCYQDVHASRVVRVAHAVGTTAAIGLLAAAIAKRSPWLALLAPVIDHAIAQASHRMEGVVTRPHRKPLWHARAELRLWRSAVRAIARRRRHRMASR